MTFFDLVAIIRFQKSLIADLVGSVLSSARKIKLSYFVEEVNTFLSISLR